MNLRELVDDLASLRGIGNDLADEDVELDEEDSAEYGQRLHEISDHLLSLIPESEIVLTPPDRESSVTRLELLAAEKGHD